MSEGTDRAPQRVIGRYALYGEIAAGGMATVHAGRLLGPVGFSRTVAIKRLHPQYAKDPEFVSMFLDEARVAARIQHPNVVSTLDVVALEGELFLVMEYVEGESLARMLRTLRSEKRLMPPKIAGSIICNALYGLHAAHEAKSERGEPLGIVHRDVSPQNILVGVDGAARVLDFGVAKAAGRVQTTREGQVKGKLAYMPPEQLAGEKVDRRLDVYAASVCLWETLTSRRLFDGENEGAVLQQVLNGKVTPPSELVEGLPAGVDEIILKGLRRNPNDRYQTAREMAVDLEDVLGVEIPRRVGAFVEECAGESIARRAARIKEIESNSTDPSADAKLSEISGVSQASAMAPVAGLALPGARPPSSSSTSLEAITPAPRPRSRNVLVALGLASLLGVSLWIVMIFAGRSDKAPAEVPRAGVGQIGPTELPQPSSAPAARSQPPAGGDTAEATGAPAGTEGPTAAPTPTDTAPKAAVTAAPRITKMSATGVHTVPTRPAANCNPPFVIVDGIRKIKPECL